MCKAPKFKGQMYISQLLYEYPKIGNTVFDLITAPALITPPPPTFLFSLILAHLTIFFLTFYSIFTYYHPLDDLLALVVENKFT